MILKSMYTCKIKRIFFLILLSVLALMSVCIPHGVFEVQDHHDNEAQFKHIVNNKPFVNLKKMLKKLRAVLIKKIELLQIALSPIVSDVSRLFLLALLFLERSSNFLFSILCFYFHGGKYRESLC